MRTGHHYANGRASYRCDWCGLVQPWGEAWLWYGSWLESEAGTALTYCCEAHASEHVASGRLHAPPPLNGKPQRVRP